MPSICSLLLDEIVLFYHTLWLSFPDLLLAELGIIVVIFAHAIQVMFNLFLLSTNLFHSCHLLVSEVFVAVMNLLLLFLLPLLHCFLLLFNPCLALLLLSLFHKHSIVILILKILQLSRLFLRLFNLLHRSHLLILQHADAISKQFDIALQLQTDRSCLVER